MSATGSGEYRVSVIIVTYNNAGVIEGCIDSVLMSTYPAVEIIVVDNDSADMTVELVRSYGDNVKIVQNTRNVGYAKAMNQGISASRGEAILSLNPDAYLCEGAITALVAAIGYHNVCGIVAPKIVRRDGRIDCAGIVNCFDLWFTNRGEEEDDRGQYDTRQIVFGATGACALYTRKMLDDVKIGNEYFDDDFFAYKEDVDISWRANTLGWKVVYEPRAVAVHQRGFRGFIPRAGMHSPAGWIERLRFSFDNRGNRHYRMVRSLSFRNTFYLCLKNYSITSFYRNIFFVLPKIAVASCLYLLCEPFVFAQTYQIMRNVKRMLRKRKYIHTMRLAEGV